jgi:hypothetical protein
MAAAELTSEHHRIGEHRITIFRRSLEKDCDYVDPYFFDEGYSLAASTGLAKVNVPR